MRQAAYLQVGPFVGQFPEYHGAMAEHLAGTKLRHWEKSLRELAAKGLGALCLGPSGALLAEKWRLKLSKPFYWIKMRSR